MYKILLFTLLSLPMFAGFFPQTVETSVKAIEANSIYLNSSFPKDGMSGIVIHSYGNDNKAITTRIVQTSSNKAQIIHSDILHHDKLPTINTPIKIKDKVIAGYLYNNVLLLAPNANTYKRITSQYSKNWIHPDLFALHLSILGEGKVTKENLASFAKKNQVGLIFIVKRNLAILLDPISAKIVAKETLKNLPTEGQFPFYMRFQDLEIGWFGSKVTGDYYNEMESI